jgi:catechol 2,3-dioxygenase-like lactoylglutathione lyase family enzyme
MSITQIDHIVVAVSDLDQTIADYRELGFNVYPGGEHPGGRSHNALVIFQDGTYFELIAFKLDRPGWRWWEVHQAYGEGLVDYALLPTEVEHDYDAIRARGLDIEGPIDGGRTRLDGQQVVWKNGRAATSNFPFFCGDVTPRSLRVPEGDVRIHDNGVTGVASVTIAVKDLEASIAGYKAILSADPLSRSQVAGLGIDSAVFAIGQQQIILVSPRGEGEQAAEIRQILTTRGEGPIGVALSSGTKQGLLDRGLAHGAVLELVAAV